MLDPVLHAGPQSGRSSASPLRCRSTQPLKTVGSSHLDAAESLQGTLLQRSARRGCNQGAPREVSILATQPILSRVRHWLPETRDDVCKADQRKRCQHMPTTMPASPPTRPIKLERGVLPKNRRPRSYHTPTCLRRTGPGQDRNDANSVPSRRTAVPRMQKDRPRQTR